LVYETMCSEHRRLEQEITSIQKKISKLPEGKLICTRNGNYTKWYQGDGHHHTYLPKKQRKHAEQLAARKYLSLKLEELQREQKAVEFYLRHHADSTNGSELLLSGESIYSELLNPYFIPDSLELKNWMDAPYERNPHFIEGCVYKTSAGIYVRSKSEALITMLLYVNKIPFRYECPLILDDITFYPDFTIRHPKTADTYYWEHFGMMDDPGYSKKAFAKLQTYAAHNILPSTNLLLTCEKAGMPFDSTIAENLIRSYFL